MKYKTVLITGAAGLLGQQHSRAVLDCGARLIITDISENSLNFAKEKLQEEFPKSDIIITRLDVSDRRSVEKTYSFLSDLKIDVNVLINNAAIDAKVKKDGEILNSSTFEDFTDYQWDLELSVGLKGAFLCSQIFGKNMAKKKVG